MDFNPALGDLLGNGLYQFNTFNVGHFGVNHPLLNAARIAYYRDLTWCWDWPFGDPGLPTQCVNGRPPLVALPAMWTDVPGELVDGQPAEICEESLFYGWVYSADEAGGTNAASGRAKIVPAAQSCLTEDYPADSGDAIVPGFGAKREKVCKTYEDAFNIYHFYLDPACDGAEPTYALGWDVAFQKAAPLENLCIG
jgi:hypothetical protein